jgi:hypothetical protein
MTKPEDQFLTKPESCAGRMQIRYLATVLLGFTLLCGFAGAHSPSDVEVRYNELSGELAVTIVHQVENPGIHYVKQVTVRQGITVLADSSYTSQPDGSSFTYNFSLPQAKGSLGEISVEVKCNQFGSRSGLLMLTRTQGPTDTLVSSDMLPATSLPTKAGAVPLIAILAAGLAAKKILR